MTSRIQSKERPLLCWILIAILMASGLLLTSCSNSLNLVGHSLNYSKQDNWLAFEENPSHEIDFIYFYPTAAVKANKRSGSANISDEMKSGAQGDYSRQGSAIGSFTNTYIPCYRQISAETCNQINDYWNYLDAVYHSQARTDCYGALDYYFENINNGRPFILGGHSQGSAILEIVLAEYMQLHPDYYERMIAAYQIGYGVSKSMLNKYTHIKFAEGEKDTGVLISWNTEGPGATLPNFVIAPDPLVINPLLWTTDTNYAGTNLNKGSMVVNALNKTKELQIPGIADAQIDPERGVVVCTTVDSYNAATEIFGDKSLHTKDWSLYYQNICDNARLRSQVYLGHAPQ